LEKLLGNIPYLNGGLFDVHELEKPDRYGKDIQIPDRAFERVFDYFDQYQWYLDERPRRADNEINPDVLGYIFEKYINQKQMGAYYTKEDITEYISKSTVIPFLFDAARARCKIAFDNPNGPTIWSLLSADPDRYIYPAVRHGVRLPFPDEIALGLDPNEPHLIARRKPWNKPAPPEYGLPTETWREVVARRSHYDYCWWRLMGLPITPTSHPAKVGTGLLPTHSGPNGGNGERAMPSPAPPRRADSASSATDEASASSAITDINDFITLNLDLRQFAQDVIETSEGPDLLMAFWQAIVSVTILDPTGGSGAFIFAALNILEPLYEACLDRMEAFLAEWGSERGHSCPLPTGCHDGADRNVRAPAQGKQLHPNYTKKFTEVLARVAAHPNRRYFVLKSIILNNLYAVDIMEEAAEICKLRLFLKLAAQVEPNSAKDNLGIEPLPDIDFNIRAGNSLVGYATKEEVRRCMKELGGGQMKLMDEEELGGFARFNTRCADVEQAFSKFRQLQTEGDGSVPHADKLELQKRLRTLEEELNRHLAGEYGVEVSDKDAYAKWVKSHQPFHWFIQFYGILARGGFDVIIGNPPYVELSTLRSQYTPKNYVTESSGNLYALCTERSFTILHTHARFGFIVQQPITSTQRMAPCRELLIRNSGFVWSSTFDDRPSKLFDGMHHARLAIILTKKTGCTADPGDLLVTAYHKWFKDERGAVFQRIRYIRVSPDAVPGVFPKLSSETEIRILAKLGACPDKLEMWLSRSETPHKLFYKITGVGSWFTITPRPPKFLRDGKESSSTRESSMALPSQATRDCAFCMLNSTLFYWFYQVRTNCRDFNPSDFKTFPLAKRLAEEDMSKLARALKRDLESSAGTVQASHSLTGSIAYEQFRPRMAKSVIDEIDTVLAGHYGFTPEELDFILNYDIKYRLGRDAEAEEE
jgi:hypothetical protein